MSIYFFILGIYTNKIRKKYKEDFDGESGALDSHGRLHQKIHKMNMLLEMKGFPCRLSYVKPIQVIPLFWN